ncbi:hypothetical protein TUZN_1338 [Thermoproteus uzoniensis 768-20]|uniref:Uncharacterized protein n=1 Tax=Thermoproteus uzoniensis (strain 768-20) TaxID=999630 RepID=F2L178_THEU7|nr:hypothetical protein [Thermoproteus uzoniensis]AEA12814.1 hypothetical protein TUZN_1338 [Thermoproteus uzoniensis 768-20]
MERKIILGIIIGGIVLGLAALGALALGASAQQQTCPPDVEVKWYALVNYLAYVSGQNASRLIAEAQASGNFTVEVSGVRLTVPYCSLNATLPNGTKAFFAPAVGVGELKKLGLNITQAKTVFQRLKEARMEAMANLTRYLRPLEVRGLREAAQALARDSGYRRAIEANANASAVLKAVAEILQRVGANKTAVEEVLNASLRHEEVADLLRYIWANGGLAGVKARAAANLSFVIANDRGYLAASAALEDLAGRLDALARALASVNATVSARLAHEAELFNKSATALAYIGREGGLRAVSNATDRDLLAALNGTYGVQNALDRVNKTLEELNETLKLLESVNASASAVEAVKAAVEHHERALGILSALESVGGPAGLVRSVYDSLEMSQPTSPQIAALCIDLNVTELLAKYAEEGFANVSAIWKYATLCEITKLLDWEYYVSKARRGVYVPMQQQLQQLRGYIDSLGGLAALNDIYKLKLILKHIASLEHDLGISTSFISSIVGIPINVTTSGGGGVSVSGGASGGGSAGGGVSIGSGGMGSGGMGGSGSISGTGKMGGGGP